MEKIKIQTETIRLDQALKLANVVSSGAEAKMVVQDGLVSVNGAITTQRGKKLRHGDRFQLDDFQGEIEEEG